MVPRELGEKGGGGGKDRETGSTLNMSVPEERET